MTGENEERSLPLDQLPKRGNIAIRAVVSEPIVFDLNHPIDLPILQFVGKSADVCAQHDRRHGLFQVPTQPLRKHRQLVRDRPELVVLVFRYDEYH